MAGYSRDSMPKPAIADGPWGEAIEHWLGVRKLRQADVVKLTGINANTVSRAARGFDCSTRVLRRIAIALDARLDEILVSPNRKVANEERDRRVTEAVKRALIEWEQPGSAKQPSDTRSDLVARIMRMPLDAVMDIAPVVADIERREGGPTRTSVFPKPASKSKKPAASKRSAAK